jgi:hypothetical protein
MGAGKPAELLVLGAASGNAGHCVSLGPRDALLQIVGRDGAMTEPSFPERLC